MRVKSYEDLKENVLGNAASGYNGSEKTVFLRETPCILPHFLILRKILDQICIKYKRSKLHMFSIKKLLKKF